MALPLLGGLVNLAILGSLGYGGFQVATKGGRRRRAALLEATGVEPLIEGGQIGRAIRDQEALRNILVESQLRELQTPTFQGATAASVQEQSMRRELEGLLGSDQLSQIATISTQGPPSILQVASQAGLL
jgi:hypothetical protein